MGEQPPEDGRVEPEGEGPAEDDTDDADDIEDDESVAAEPPAADPMQAIEFAAADAAFLQPAKAHDKTWLLLITLVLFAGASLLQGSATTLPELATLVGVILLHELGHAAAMLAFRYTDVRVFFIPFFGAAASGQRHGVARWKQGLVLMMGPLPGLVLGCVLLLRGSDGLVHAAALQLVAINAFNLLPIAPFDGGQLFHLVLFSRHRHLEIGFLTVAALAVIGLALLLKAWIFGVLGLFMLLSVPVRKQVLAAANELRDDNLPEDPRTLDEPQRRRLFDVLWTRMAPQWRGKPVQQAATMEQVHASASQRPLSIGASAAVGALWIAGLAITAVAVTTIYDLGPTDEPVAPAQWQRYHDTGGTFSIELPAQPIQSVENGQNALLATRGTRQYGVFWSEVLSEERWDDVDTVILGDSSRRLRDIPVPAGERSFVMKTKEGMFTAVRVLRRGKVGYFILAGAYIDDPEIDRVVRSFQFEGLAPP